MAVGQICHVQARDTCFSLTCSVVNLLTFLLGADYMSRAGSVAGLARSTEMTAQPGIT